jgi:putative ABC transport system permease protein
MNATRLLAISLRSLIRYPLRSALLMLGTFVGVAALTLVLSAGRSVEQRVLETIRRNFSTSSIVVSTGAPILVGGPRDEGARLTLDDAAALGGLSAVETWDPILSLDGIQVRRGEASTTTRILANSERAPRVWARGAARGDYFDAAQVSSSARVAVLGQNTAADLFGTEDPIGAEIQVAGVPFRVIGLLEAIGTDAHGNDRDAEVAVPLTAAMRRLANVDTIAGVRLVMRDPLQVEATAREVRSLLRERHGLAGDRVDDFRLVTPVAIQKMVKRMESVFFVFLPLVAAAALLAGVLVAATIMLLSVSERTGEIGLRRALGARPGDVARQILVETAVTTTLGGLLGVAVGGVVLMAASQAFRLPMFVSWPAVLLGLLLSVVTGVAAGFLPARRAERLHPVEALRA